MVWGLLINSPLNHFDFLQIVSIEPCLNKQNYNFVIQCKDSIETHFSLITPHCDPLLISLRVYEFAKICHHYRCLSKFCKNLVQVCDAILSRKGIEQKISSRLGQRCKRRSQGSHEPQDRFRVHGLSMNSLIFIHIRLMFHYFWTP